MRQQQVQKTTQELSLTLGMRRSLELLSLGQQDAVAMLIKEARRNPYLRIAPPPLSSGSGVEPPRETAQKEDARKALIGQVGLIRFEAQGDAEIARELVHNLNDYGLLEDCPATLARILGVPENAVRRVVSQLQAKIEPVGLFAWSLKDCFRLQLQDANRYDAIIAQLVDRLDLVACQSVDKIRAELDVDTEDAEEMLEDIRTLCAAPLTVEQEIYEPPTEPDLIIAETASGDLEAQLNAPAFPQILVDDGLFSIREMVNQDAETRAYYRDCYQTASQMVSAFQKRANTLLRIGKAFVAHQEKFIRSGQPGQKRPLSMSVLASDTGLHKSTISRALRDCQVKTMRGVLMAHDLLARDISTACGERTQEQAIRRLKTLIKAENPRAPHSDQELVCQMAHAGFHLSRRTIAKYRGLADIPGSHKRRKAQKYR